MPPQQTLPDLVLRTRDLAEIAGVTPRALRHYHQVGLLPEVPRDVNGYRRYSTQDLVRVLRIRQLAESGMPLRMVGNALDHDRRSQDQRLAELDRHLSTQADQIAAQRALIAQLRSAAATPFEPHTGSRSFTAQLDRDIWTLMSALAPASAAAAAKLLGAVAPEELRRQITPWYADFLRLEGAEHIDAAAADQLAGHMARFVRDLPAVAFTDPGSDFPIMPLVEQLQNEALSPAQHTVWARFLALIEPLLAETSTPVPP